MSRKALIVGIDYYERISALKGCVDDAYNVKTVIARHGDSSVNFDVRLLTGTGSGDTVSRADLHDAVQELFRDDSEIALFYFAGHGYIDSIDGCLCASDTRDGHDGLSLSTIVAMANKSPAKNRLIVLDSCHAGIAGASRPDGRFSEMREGTTIMTASTAEQYAIEGEGGGVFTALFVDALRAGPRTSSARSPQAACTPTSIARWARGSNAPSSRPT